MKIFLYSPYIPEHFGGGEKYLLDIARTLAANPNHQVNLAISIKHTLSAVKLKEIKYQYEQYFSYNLKKVKFVSTPLGSNTNFFRKLFWTKHYDLGYYLTDGSLFFSMAKKNILHVQVPLKLDKSSFIEKKKLQSWNVITTNSNFTKSIIEPSWNTKVTQVHQPMIEVDQLIAQSNFDQKEKIATRVHCFHSDTGNLNNSFFKKLLKSRHKAHSSDTSFSFSSNWSCCRIFLHTKKKNYHVYINSINTVYVLFCFKLFSSLHRIFQ